MEKLLITCRSMTQAQRSQRLLEKSGIVSSVVKTPIHLTKTGCGYALILRRGGSEAVEILRERGMLTGKVYERVGESWRERTDDLS